MLRRVGDLYDQDDEPDDDGFWEETTPTRLEARMTAVYVLIGLAAGLVTFAATLLVQWLWRLR